MAELKEKAYCRWCRKELRATDSYCRGGIAYLENGGRAPINYYGDFVCSYHCDWNACLELEQSMPGHGPGQKRVGQEAQRKLNHNWNI